MTLAQVKKGTKVTIEEISDELVRVQAMRFGIAEGTEVLCVEKIPYGPVIIRKRFQEIAIGHLLAEKIKVSA